MYEKFFECADAPQPVFGSNVETKPFTPQDVTAVHHWIDTSEEFIGIFELKDGRFASIFCKKQPDFVLENEIINESVAHVALSYEEIVRLGLTNSTRDALGL